MRHSKASLMAGAFFYGLAAVAGLAGIGFATWALYLLFAQVFVPWGAALATGGVLIAFALLVVAFRRLWKAMSTPDARTAESSAARGGERVGLVDSALLDLVRSKPRSAVLVAMLAGTALGASPELRRKVGRFLKDFGEDYRGRCD